MAAGIVNNFSNRSKHKFMDFQINFNDLQEQARRGVFNLISALSAISPVLLVVSMLALFMCLGYFQYLHFAETMTKPMMAGIAAALYQLIRFGTALASIRLFSARAYFRAVLSLAASFVLTYLENGMVVETAGAISTNVAGAVEVNAWVIGIFVWLSFALEVFVSVTLKSMFDNAPVSSSTRNFSANGTGAHIPNGQRQHAPA